MKGKIEEKWQKVNNNQKLKEKMKKVLAFTQYIFTFEDKAAVKRAEDEKRRVKGISELSIGRLRGRHQGGSPGR